MTTPTQAPPLYTLHKKLNAKFVSFAGYLMPLQYAGIITEHNHTRKYASLFDVSHMGQAILKSSGNVQKSLEKLVTGNIQELKPGQMRYTLLTNEKGGIIDDLMVTWTGEHLILVINANNKKENFTYLKNNLPECSLEIIEHNALLALQGPTAASILSQFTNEHENLAFLNGKNMTVNGIKCYVTRSGYTGEDGFEISVHQEQAEKLADSFLDSSHLLPAGLGARDSLRLEAGLCLHGSDITSETTPIEATLRWAIGKRRLEEKNFPGAKIICQQIANIPPKKRIGLKITGKLPARTGAAILAEEGQTIGTITSGGYSPTLETAIAMGYVPPEYAQENQKLTLAVRNKILHATVVKLPFITPNYFRGKTL